MTDIIYERGQARESIIWNPFQYNGPFNATQEVERAIIFGLYANTYLYGYNYLQEIETEDLARLVDNYNAAIAQITSAEAQTVLEIAAKRYIEQIDQQIHEENLVTRGKKINALDEEYDAREDALDADREAIVTKQAEVQLAWDRATQKIKDLEMRVELEDVAQQLVEVDITEQELRAAKSDLSEIEAGLKGLDIQLAITQVGIDISNTQLQVTETETRETQIDVDISEVDLAVSQVAIDVIETGVRESEVELEGLKIQADIKKVNTSITEAGVRKSQIEMDGEKIQSDTAGVGVRVTETETAESMVEFEGQKILSDVTGVKIRKTDAEVAKTQVELDGQKIQLDTVETAVRITETEMAESQTELDGQKIQLDTSKVRVDISKIDMEDLMVDAEEHKYDADIAGIEADTSKLKLVDNELAITEVDETILGIENDLLIQRKELIDGQGDNLETEIEFLKDQLTDQEELDDKIVEHDQAEHDFDIDVSDKETDFKDHISEKKVDVLKKDKQDLVDAIRTRKYKDAKEKIKTAKTRWKAQEAYKDAAIEAAQMIADADLITTLTHSIGEGTASTPETQNWSTKTSI